MPYHSDEAMSKPLKIADVLVFADVRGCLYQIMSLTDGQFAFMWGNRRCSVGDELAVEAADPPSPGSDVKITSTFEGAEGLYRQHAWALQQAGNPAGDEMLAELKSFLDRGNLLGKGLSED